MCQVSTLDKFLFLRYRVRWGVKTGQNGVFLDFLKKLMFDLVHSPREWSHYDSTHVCQVSTSGKFLFLTYWVKYGVKRGQNGVFRDFLRKCIFDLVLSPRERSYYNSTHVCQVSTSGNFLFLRYWVKWGGQKGSKWGFSRFSQKLAQQFRSFS